MEADLQLLVDGCIGAHRRLLATLEVVDDATARGLSQLPAWTRGHVLTHLARNADSHVRLLQAAGEGRVVEQYEGGLTQRAADIEAGALRAASALCDDVRSSVDRLETTWSETTEAGWQGTGLMTGTPWPCRLLPFQRWREVEIHHVDLGLAYTPEDWPEEYVARELPAALLGLPERLAAGDERRHMLAWLLGREDHVPPLTVPWQSQGEYYFASATDCR